MRIEKKTVLRLAVGAFLLYLAVYYWSAAANFLGLLLSAMKPIILGAAMAYLLNILMRFYERLYFPRDRRPLIIRSRRPVCLLGAILTMVAIVALAVSIVLPQFMACISTLVQKAPDAVAWILEKPWAMKWIPEELAASLSQMDWETSIEHILDLLGSGLLLDAAGGITEAVFSLFSGLVTALFSLLFAVYILLGKERMGGYCRRLLHHYVPDKWEVRVLWAQGLLDSSFSRYIVGQCMEALLLGGLCALGMMLLRLPYAAMIGALVGLTALIPVAGAYIGAGVGAFMILAVAPKKALIFLVFIVILQQLEGNLIYPKVVGTQIGLPPILVLAAVTVGGALFGVAGMLIGVPLTAAVYRAIREDLDKREKQAPST